MLFWNQTARQFSSFNSLEKIPIKTHFNFMIYLQWSHAGCWVSISFLSAPKPSTFHSILVQCHQLDIRLINPELPESYFEKSELPPVCHCICKFSQSQDIQHLGLEFWPHLMMRDALPDTSDQKLLPLLTKMGEKQEADISFFLSSPGAT